MTDIAKPRISHKPIIDVAHPNHSAPSDNSRAVIVNNRPLLHDPMMSHDESDSSKSNDDNLLSPAVITKINIQPISDDKTDEINSRVESVPETVTEIESIKEDKSENSILADNQVDSKSPQDKINDETAIQAKHEAELDELVEAKAYFLPINTATHQRTKRFVIIGVGMSLLLAIIWVDVALDAGLIKIGSLKALTHIFST